MNSQTWKYYHSDMYKRSRFSKNRDWFISISTVSKLILVLVLKLLLFLLLQIDAKAFVYNHINKEERWLLKEPI